MPRRLVYLGTPDMAVPSLETLAAAGHDIALVVTRPDRRRGRGTATSPSPVKAAAARLGIAVAHSLDELEAALDDLDLGVVVAYGRIIPARILARLPMVNIHFSLLPRWRGAAPVERAILAGDERTGACVMALEPELDTGPIYATAALDIAPGEHLASLRARLVETGARLLADTLAGPLPEPRPQAGPPTYADKVTPDELRLDWALPASELHRVVRLDRAWTTWRSRRLLILDAEVLAVPLGAAAHAGELVDDVAVTGEGGLRLVRVQPEGRAPMGMADWRRGAHPGPGERLGS